MKFRLLDSGSKGNACLVMSENTTLLVDCGSSWRYLKSQIDSLQLDALLVTHEHSDHMKQIDHFSDYPCYLPLAIERPHILVSPYQKFQIKDIYVLPFPLSHDCQAIVGYIFYHQKEKLVYITDTGYLRKKDIEYCYNADYIIIESNFDMAMLMNSARPLVLKQRIISDTGHLSNEQCATYLKAMVGPATKHIVLAHLSQEANTPHLALNTVRQVIPDYSGKIETAKQRTVIEGGF